MQPGSVNNVVIVVLQSCEKEIEQLFRNVFLSGLEKLSDAGDLGIAAFEFEIGSMLLPANDESSRTYNTSLGILVKIACESKPGGDTDAGIARVGDAKSKRDLRIRFVGPSGYRYGCQQAAITASVMSFSLLRRSPQEDQGN